MNKFDEVRMAVNEAREQLNAADAFVRTMAGMISGRLRVGNVSNNVLSALKKELRDYNMHTGKWSDK